MPRFRKSLLSPLTRKRWRRFRSNRRAWRSLLALTGLYALSLGAELLCNDRPLLVRLHGRTYFPFARFHTQHDLLGNDRHTRVDYAALRESAAFTSRTGNFMLRAPVPFGPHQVIDPASLEPYRRAVLTVTPEVSLGRLNLSEDGRISRPLGCAPFFPGLGADALADASFTNYWVVTAALDDALAARFDNRHAPAFETVLARRGDATLHLAVSLLAYTARETPPRTVRLALSKPDGHQRAPLNMTFTHHQGTPVALRRRDWERVPSEQRAPLLDLVRRAFARNSPTELSELPWFDTSARAVCRSAAITWPHRPVPGHWMGIDAAGRDVLARVLYGLRIALTFGLLLVVWAMLLGFMIGAVQGYFGSWIDLSVQRVIEIWSALPFLYIMILVGAVLGRSFGLLLLCYGLFNWIGVSYYMRAEFLRLRRRAFVDAARCQGLSAARIMTRHVLPNALTPLITLMPFSLVGAVAALTALDYLGFGLPPLTPSWGELLQQAQQARAAWWLILYPSAMLFTVMLLTVLIGEGLRDAFDPKPRSRLS